MLVIDHLLIGEVRLLAIFAFASLWRRANDVMLAGEHIDL